MIRKKQQSQQHEIKCEHCGVDLICENEDIDIGLFGCQTIICPECGYELFVDGGIRLSAPIFPRTFYFRSEDAKQLTNEEINRTIEIGLHYLKENSDEDFYSSQCGDTTVIVLKYADEVEVFVGKNYASDSLTIEDFNKLVK